MIYCLSSSSGVCHSDTASASTNGMIARLRGNISSHNGYLMDNASSSHRDPMNSASTAGKLKTVYVGGTDTLYPSFS